MFNSESISAAQKAVPLHFIQALELFRNLGNRYDEADTLSHLAPTYLALGQFDNARRTGQLTLDIYHDQRRTTEVERTHQQLAELDH